MRLSYTPRPSVEHLKEIAKFSVRCEQEKCLNKVPPFSHYRFFKFSRSQKPSPHNSESKFSTLSQVKESPNDDWTFLPDTRGAGFLAEVPDLSATLPTEIVSPTNIDEIEKHLCSVDAIINDSRKVDQLRTLVNDVYRNREFPFHWDVSSCI